MKDNSGEGYVGGAARETDLCQTEMRDYTNAGSWPCRAKTALIFAILDMSVAIVPTIIQLDHVNTYTMCVEQPDEDEDCARFCMSTIRESERGTDRSDRSRLAITLRGKH
jgi:hypothetical protein